MGDLWRERYFALDVSSSRMGQGAAQAATAAGRAPPIGRCRDRSPDHGMRMPWSACAGPGPTGRRCRAPAAVVVFTRCVVSRPPRWPVVGRRESMPGWWTSRSLQNTASRGQGTQDWCSPARVAVRRGSPPAGRGPAGRRSIAVDQLRDALLPRRGEHPHRCRRVGTEDVQGVQQFVEVQARVAPDPSRGRACTGAGSLQP